MLWEAEGSGKFGPEDGFVFIHASLEGFLRKEIRNLPDHKHTALNRWKKRHDSMGMQRIIEVLKSKFQRFWHEFSSIVGPEQRATSKQRQQKKSWDSSLSALTRQKQVASSFSAVSSQEFGPSSNNFLFYVAPLALIFAPFIFCSTSPMPLLEMDHHHTFQYLILSFPVCTWALY